ncbi:MAG: hypothetical protein ACLPX9_20565 [Rhodomicrobium sp.]
MKKLLVLACATSALALASGANAQNYNIQISGNVGTTCTIGSPTAYDVGTGAADNVSYNSVGASFTYNSNFADSNGHLKGVAGWVDIPVSTNHACAFSLTTVNGALTSSGNTPINYNAGLAGGDANPTSSFVQTNGSPGAQIGSITVTPSSYTAGYGAANVSVGFSVSSDSTTHGTGVYQDTLQLTINPA